MKKSLLLLPFLFLLFSNSISAQYNRGLAGHNFSLSVPFGLMSGRAEEIVYQDSVSNDKLSLLLWPFNPLLFSGLNLHYFWMERKEQALYFVDVYSRFGFDPLGSGKMENRDWTDIMNTGWLTHYSEHDLGLERAIVLDLDAGFSTHLDNDIWLKCFLTYSFMDFAFTASGGSVLYPIDSARNDLHYPLEQIDVVTYRQSWHLLGGGAGLGFFAHNYFDALIYFKAGTGWLETMDEHLLRDLIITEKMSGALFFEPGVRLSFRPRSIWAFNLNYSYRYIGNSRGDSTYKWLGGRTVTFTQIGGAVFSSHTFDMAVEVKFGRKRR